MADPLTDGVFFHCGTDAIDLVKVDGEWNIGNSSWTVQKTSCTKHLDGPPPEAENSPLPAGPQPGFGQYPD